MVDRDFSFARETVDKNFPVCMVVSVVLEGTVDVRDMPVAQKTMQVVEVLDEVADVV